MAARTCARCGSPLAEGQRFCVNCGAPVPEAASAPPPEEQPTPPASWTPLPPAPAPTPLPPKPVAQRPPSPPWTSWLGVGGCGLLSLATGLIWFEGFDANAFEFPLASLWSDTAAGGVPIAIPFLVIAAAGLIVAMVWPASGPLGTTLLIAGALSVLLAGWFVIRILANAQGAPVLDVLGIGVWGAILGSLVILGAGIGRLLAKPGR